MSEIKTGGPAFPVLMNWEGGEPIQGAQTGNSTGYAAGLTIRDYAAFKMMSTYFPAYPRDIAAEFCYKDADAMLKAREATT